MCYCTSSTCKEKKELKKNGFDYNKNSGRAIRENKYTTLL